MSVAVKICGINSALAFDAAVAAGADWLGFNFFPPSPRFVAPEAAASLSARHPGGPLRVGLFVDPDPALVEATMATVKLDILQLHAPAAMVAALRAQFGLPVWLPVAVGDASDLPPGPDGVDALLLDAKPPAQATRPGGNARSFDWSVLRGWKAPLPWLLAGGLTPGNVAAAIAATGAVAVDVSSGVESAPGRKDAALIRRFIDAAKQQARPVGT